MTLIVSYSEIFKWQTCQRQYYYRYHLGYAPVIDSGPMGLGIKGHKLLEVFYEALKSGLTKEESLKKTLETAEKIMREASITDLSILKAWTLVDNYIRANDFTTEIELIENRFLVPVSNFSDDPVMSDVQIGFTPDVVFRRNGGFLDIEDYKFTGRAWSQSKMNRFSQIKLYQIFLESMGYDISRTILRFFNTTTGKITIKPYTATAIEKETLIRDFLAGVREVVMYRKGSLHYLAPRTVNYTACQFCKFEFPCTLEAEGKDASRTLEAEYVYHNRRR